MKKTNKEESNNKMKRVIYLDILKIIACILVVINHSGLTLFKYVGYTKMSVLFYSTTFALSKIAVPIFLMVTGALILNKKEYTIRNGLKGIIRVLVPLLVLSLFIYIKNNSYDVNFLIKFIEEPLRTLYWYLYMLIGLYLVFPMLNKMTKNLEIKDLKYLIIICLLIPGTTSLISRIFNIQISAYFTSSLLCFPIMYSIAGLYLSKVEINKKNRNIAFIALVIPILFFAGFMYNSFIKTGEISYILDNSALITIALPAMATFYLIRYFSYNKEINLKLENIIYKISNITFGVYLFHSFAFHTIELSINKIYCFNAYLGIISNQIICFALCGLVTYILQKIPIVKKFL